MVEQRSSSNCPRIGKISMLEVYGAVLHSLFEGSEWRGEYPVPSFEYGDLSERWCEDTDADSSDEHQCVDGEVCDPVIFLYGPGVR